VPSRVLHLHSLDLSGDILTYIAVDALQQRPLLEHLDLRNARMCYGGGHLFCVVRQFRCLRTLNGSGNPRALVGRW
jgi:hypothetical protein